MKKLAALFIIFGGGLAAFGFSGWAAGGRTTFTIAEGTGQNWELSAGWPLHSQVEITIGIALLAGGVMLHKDSK